MDDDWKGKVKTTKDIQEGKFDVSKFNPLTRLGYRDYSVVREIFSISRPDD